MRAIMISIKPQHVANILNGNKTVEVRKTFPKDFLKKKHESYTVYIYCTKDKKYANLINRGGFLTGMVVAKFQLQRITPISPINAAYWCLEACLSEDEMKDYLDGEIGYLWHIDKLEILDKPRELSSFLVYSHSVSGVGMDGKQKIFDIMRPLTKAPQSWCYVEVL